MKKREFLKSFGNTLMISPFLSFDLRNNDNDLYSDRSLLNDKEFWNRIRKDYSLKKDYINLENGYYNIIPNPTLKKFISHVKNVNFEGSYYMRTKRTNDNRRVANRLAKLVGCSDDELVITRNTTESLDLIIGGFPWKKEDEAIYAIQDYGAMQQMFKLVSKRYGILNKIVSIPNHPISDEQIVSIYEDQITPKTRLIMVSHMINITGHILPIRKICDMAHKYGVDVMVDGAHCIGHFDVNISELNCDYYGSSLHKWLSTPLGAGLLYVSKSKVSKIWPLLGSHINEKDNILRLNHIGTHPVHTDLAIENAIDYIEMIGIKRKEERLREIQRYWSDQLRNFENVIINTPLESFKSCGIANVGIKGLDPSKLEKVLFDDYNIFTVAINHENVKGCRITPNIYTNFSDLDHFVSSIKEIASRNIH
jgi:selenocysteine lyase/cysteine desulfurase